NGLGVVRHIDFYDEYMDFSTSPTDAKDKYDAVTLIPVLENYYARHFNFKYIYFLGDACFNALGIPTCPNNPTLDMKFDGITREKGRSDRIKYLCPKSKKCRINGRTAYNLTCDNPCTTSKCGRVVQVSVNSDYRLNTAIPRNTQQWQDLYKIRTVCERAIKTLVA
ncbi:MAG: DDE transposase, partial [Romboutsia sp.]